MKILVDSLPETREECVFRESCPEYDICHDPENCLKLTSVKFKVHLGAEDVTKDIIKKLKIMPDLSGHDYIIRAVIIIREHEKRLGAISIYEQVANYYDINWKAVERDIRTSINKAYFNFDDEAKRLYQSICGTDQKISNNSFLRCLSDFVSLKMSGFIE